MKDVDASSYIQKGKNSYRLFCCTEKESDLRGTGALKYIKAMADVPAPVKKQSGKQLTMQEALKNQSGSLWYAPKAAPHESRIWFRKAVDGVFAPYLFSNPVVFDQRCNYIDPKTGIEWKVIAAIVTSTIFALAVESEGISAMGAGALEMTTKLLREVRIPDVRSLDKKQRKKLVELAEAVWAKENPIDWGEQTRSGKAMQNLDTWLLKVLHPETTIDTIYKDLHQTCRARLDMAKRHREAPKRAISQDVQSVADAIAKSIRPVIDAYRFPESFYPEDSQKVAYQFDAKDLSIQVSPFLSMSHVTILDNSGIVLLDKDYPKAVSEVLIRALLIGRRNVSIPTEATIASKVLDGFFEWFSEIRSRIDEGWRNSALGTRFEDELRRAVYAQLKIHPNVDSQKLEGVMSHSI
jgi:hypothetical protein